MSYTLRLVDQLRHLYFELLSRFGLQEQFIISLCLKYQCFMKVRSLMQEGSVIMIQLLIPKFFRKQANIHATLHSAYHKEVENRKKMFNFFLCAKPVLPLSGKMNESSVFTDLLLLKLYHNIIV